MSGKEKQTEWDRFPGTLKNPSDYQPGSGDYGVKFVVPMKHVGYLQPLMQKAEKHFAIFIFPASSIDQAEQLIKSQEFSPDRPALPDPRAPQPSGGDVHLVSLETLAEVLGVDPRTVQLDAEKGILVRTSRGQYDTLASCGTLRRALMDALTGKNDAINDEKAKTIRFNREKKEIDLHERMRTLVNYEEVQALREKKNAVMRQKLLFLEKSLPPKLGGLTANEQEPIIRNEVRKLLTEFATLEGPAGSAGRGGQDIPAAAGPDREPVGGRKKKARRKNKR